MAMPLHTHARSPGRPPSIARRAIPILALLVAAAAPAAAQMADDGIMLRRHQLRSTIEYASESWSRYWEGSLERSNDNIGTLTTRTTALMAAYGVSDRVSVFAAAPYVSTHASAGVLHGMSGWQDFSLSAKARVLNTTVGQRMTLGASALVGVAAPISSYTPDFLPLSIGLGSRSAVARGVLHLQDSTGVFAEGSLAHTWRSTVHLDRDAYYTNGQLVLSNEVAMPDVSEYAATIGYQRGRICLPLSLVGQHTLGGGDIRRQDMPFVSNRMDFTRIQGRLMYTVPRLRGVVANFGAMHVLSGRNVGKSTGFSFGLTSVLGL